MSEDFLNFHQATPEIATSGQPKAEQFSDIASKGYLNVINLALSDSDNAIANEGELVTKEGMSFYHIPVPFDAPTEEHYRKFSAIMDALEGEKVWVHCVVNARISAFMYRYLREHRGFSKDAATSPLLKKWRERMDEVWTEFLSRTP